MKILILSLLSFAIASIQMEGQTATIRGMYVNGFNTLLGNQQKEDSLLNYAQRNNFNYLALYNLLSINDSYSLIDKGASIDLANFIQKAKQKYGIKQVGAVGESYEFFYNLIRVYNEQHDPIQRFDVYNVEFEFWNTKSIGYGKYYCIEYLQPAGCKCDTSGSFRYYKNLIRRVDSLAKAEGIISELYVGWFNQGQAITLSNSVDRILLHDYVNIYSTLFANINTRLKSLAARKVKTEVILLLSAEPTWLGSWLTSHPIVQPYNDVIKEIANSSPTWNQYINLNGYQWFTYSEMPSTPISMDVPYEDASSFMIYPNPNNGIFKIILEDNQNSILEIYNLLGEKVFFKEFITDTTIEINLDIQVKGLYFYQITSKDHPVKSGKIIIE